MTLFLIESQSVKPAAGELQFSMTFNQPPDFLTIDSFSRSANDFQYYMPKSLIRGPEIYITGNMIPIRSYGPAESSIASGGWGPVIATIPFNLSGDTVTFSAPLGLFSNSLDFTYSLQTDYYGAQQELIMGSTVPEPATWILMFLGFALILIKWRLI